MVLGATSRIKPNQLNVEEAYNWLGFILEVAPRTIN